VWTFQPGWSWAGVIWALGWSMVILAGAVRLPLAVVVALGAALVGLHDLATSVRPESFGRLAWLWHVLHVPGPMAPPIGPERFFVLYPLVPWAGVMLLGYGLGRLLEAPAARRRRLLGLGGLGAVALFLVLRLGNLYGNPAEPWSYGAPGNFAVQPTWSATLIALLDTEKYPASLQYLLMTLGPALLLLAAFETDRLRPRALVTIGRVPLFFYLLHLPVIRLAARGLAVALGQPAERLGWNGTLPGLPPPGYGHGLGRVLLLWIAILILLWPACRAFAHLKARRRDAWLSYL
jgi:uncharacterized membrane protein